MSLLSRTIGTLLGGVSQQAIYSRLDSQATEQINCISSPLEGLGRRPGTYHVAGLPKIEGAHWHVINRDDNEKYLAAFTNTGIRVFDLQGVEKTVSVSPSGQAYLAGTPVEDFETLTVNDYTFFLNKDKTVQTLPVAYSWDDILAATVRFTPNAREWLVAVVLPRSQQVTPTGSWNQAFAVLPGFSTKEYITKFFKTYSAARDFVRRVYLPSLRYTNSGLPVNFTWPTADQTTYDGNIWKGERPGAISVVSPMDGDQKVINTSLSYSDCFNAMGTIGLDPDAPAELSNLLALRLYNDYTEGDGGNTGDTLGVERGVQGYFIQVPGNFPYPVSTPMFLVRPGDETTRYNPPSPGSEGNLAYAGLPTSGFYPAGEAEALVAQSVQGSQSLGDATADGLSVNGQFFQEDVSASDPAGYFGEVIGAAFPSLTLTPGVNELVIEAPTGQSLQVNTSRSIFATVAYERGSTTNRLFIVIKNGVAEQTYRVSINGQQASFTTGTTEQTDTWKPDHIASQLATTINGWPNFTAQTFGSFISVSVPANVDLKFDYFDTWNGQGMYAMKDKVQAFEDLPLKFIPDYPIEVVGEGGAEGYYVQYTRLDDPLGARYEEQDGLLIPVQDGSEVNSVSYSGWTAQEGRQSGIWEETVRKGLVNHLDPSTMPHALIRKDDGSFSFEPLLWEPRKVGDDKSVEMPSFVGRKIRDLFFHRGRMGFLTEDTIVMSRSGNFFNFFPQTAKSVLDNDPIDVSVVNTKVTELRHAVSFNTALLLFADNCQYQVTANSVLTPRTVTIQPTTEYEINPQVRPINVGQSVLFTGLRGDSLAVWETEVMPGQFLTVATDVSLHVPNYIPASVRHFVSNNTENFMAAYSGTDQWLYCYQYLWSGEEKAQEAWHKWSVGEAVIHADFVGSRLYLVVQRGGNYKLEYLELKGRHVEPGLDYQVCLDGKTFSGGVWSGVPYTSEFVFSPVFMRDNKGNPMTDYRLVLRTFGVNLAGTRSVELRVKPFKRAERVVPFDSPEAAQKLLRTAVLDESHKVQIRLVSSSNKPFWAHSAVWEATGVPRTQRLN